MNEWQKAAERLHDAAGKYREAIDAEQEAFDEWVKAGKALDELEQSPHATEEPRG